MWKMQAQSPFENTCSQPLISTNFSFLGQAVLSFKLTFYLSYVKLNLRWILSRSKEGRERVGGARDRFCWMRQMLVRVITSQMLDF